MRLTLFLAALLVQPLKAQSGGMSLHLEISEGWRIQEGDDPRWAQPGFDDSSWRMVNMPLPPPRPLGGNASYAWLRRVVVLPPGPGSEVPLAITVGSLFGTYELFVNGESAARTDSLPAVAYPRTFRLPPTQGSRLLVAIRWYHDRHPWPVAWRPADSGPWLITSADSAPDQPGKNALAVHKLSRLGDFAGGMVLLCMASLILIIWFNQRTRWDLFWVGAYLTLLALGRINLFAQIGPDPLAYPRLGLHILAVWPAPVLAQYVAAWTGQRWLAAPSWVVSAVGAFTLSSAHLPLSTGPLWMVGLMTLGALAVHAWRFRRDALFCAGVALVTYLHTGGWGRVDQFGLPRLAQTEVRGWIPFVLVWHLITASVLAVAVTVREVRRLLTDRDEKLRLASELEAARTVQQLLLPQSAVDSPHFETQAVYEPARQVGGDFYWTRTEPNGGLIVAVGDVSGKGLKAAMLVSVAIGILRNEKSGSPGAILGALNDGLADHTGGGFVTCCCARFDATGSVTIANAGHPSPYCDGREVDVEAGLPLGVVAGVAYEESVVTGERFTFVSDGVVEAENAKRELFGFERTREISGKSAREIAQAAKAWGQNDDITVVTVRRRA